MKTSLHFFAVSLAAVLMASGSASPQVSRAGYWDGPARSGPGFYATGTGPSQVGAPYMMASQAPSELGAPTLSPPYAAAPAEAPKLDLSNPSALGLGNGAPCATDEACGASCGTSCAPRRCQWLGGIDALFMTRLSSSSYPLIWIPEPVGTMNFDAPVTVLDASSMDFDWEFGYRINAAYLHECGWGVELGFFGISDGWGFDRTYEGILEFNGPGYTFGSDPDFAFPTDDPVSFRVTNRTKLYSTELNAIHGLCDWATLRVGLRWFSIEDRFHIDEVFLPLPDVFCTRVQNNPFGPQIGADFKLLEMFSGRFRVNANVNAGFLYNHITMKMCSSYVGPWLYADTNELAIMGEAGLTAKCRLTDHLAVRCGYQVLGLNGVALAADQVAVNDVVLGYGRICTGSLIAHGASVGLEFFW
jgi:hypothetical protein